MPGQLGGRAQGVHKRPLATDDEDVCHAVHF
jgi:hypothetical protein